MFVHPLCRVCTNNSKVTIVYYHTNAYVEFIVLKVFLRVIPRPFFRIMCKEKVIQNHAIIILKNH